MTVKKNNCELVGAFVPLHITMYLNLFAEFKGHSKSRVVQNQLAKWYEKIIEECPFDVLLSRKIAMYQDSWDMSKVGDDNKITFPDFIKGIEAELIKRKFDLPTIKCITDAIKR